MPIHTNLSSVTRFATYAEAGNLQVRQQKEAGRQIGSLGSHETSLGKRPFQAKSKMGVAVALLGAAAVPMAFILIGLVHLV